MSRHTSVSVDALALAIAALTASPQRCQFHGEDFERAGVRRGQPACDSCKQPWRVARALAALAGAHGDGGTGR